MSICRWSSDDYQCDVYVYADVAGGYTTEVAARRMVWKVALPPEVDLPTGDAGTEERSRWAGAHAGRAATVSRLLRDESNYDYLELPTPEGGDYYRHDTAEECAANLERLRSLGFNVPQSAIDALLDEYSQREGKRRE